MLKLKKIYPGIGIYLALHMGVLYAQTESDSTAGCETKLNAYPYAYYTPETQLAFGAGGVVTFFTQKNAVIHCGAWTIARPYRL